jgi:hypothetical protein
MLALHSAHHASRSMHRVTLMQSIPGIEGRMRRGFYKAEALYNCGTYILSSHGDRPPSHTDTLA